MRAGTHVGFTPEALEELSKRDGAYARLRAEAFEQFRTMPMPSPETEEWRYTDLREFDLSPFVPLALRPAAATLDEVDPALLEAVGALGERAGLAIQHDSSVVSVHLDPDLAQRGVVFSSLDEALQARPELVDGRLHGIVPTGRTRFTALHGAFRSGGVLLYVPRDVRVEVPLQALTYLGREDLAVFPHTLVVLEEGAEATLIDRYVSPALGRALSDAVVELYLGPSSRLTYVALQDWGTGVTHLSVQRAVLSRDAELRSLAVAFGASLSRMEVESVLAEDGGSSEMLGVYFARGRQHFDFRTIQDHVGNRTASDLLYKGALKGRSRAVYSGTVIIEKDAHRCDAYQANRNILLSDRAKADSIPNLEILTNDPVRCGHAASVGPVDEEALFYLQSRGIPYREAERLIVFGFFQEVLDRVALPEVRARLEDAIEKELETVEDEEDHAG
ncbi:MAG TPA: Fe-S cluster assembly protein SufD [Actinomycetota bacterium]|nr:Fe-S cluster assembly protein SufD [Actinomycetota bacterium]